MELKKIRIWSFAKIAAIFGLVSGIIQIVLLAIAKKFTESLPVAEQLNIQPIEFTWSSAIISLVTIVVVYFIIGVLAVFIYNIVAKYVGGIKLEFKK